MKFLREILTIFACLLVLALSAALAGPYFIDWKDYRGVFEERLSQASGAQVRIAGDVDVQLLPTPRLVLGKVSLQEAGLNAGPVSAERVQLEIAPMGLLRGDIRFTDISIENPDVHLRADGDGSFALPQGLKRHAGQISFENIVVKQGRLRIDTAAPGGSLVVENIALEMSALSLTGPWRGTGALNLEAGRLSFYFNSGVAEHDRLRLKFVIEATRNFPHSEFDGAILVTGNANARASFVLEGQAKLNGVLNAEDKKSFGHKTPWEITGPLRMDARGVALEPLELRTGGEERTLSATGFARFVFGETLGDVSLTAPRIDADYLSGLQAQPGAAMGAVGDFAGSFLSGARGLPPVRLSLKSPALTIGGETLSDISLALTPVDVQSTAIVLRSGLPGRAAILMDGAIEAGAAARFKGQLKFEARDLDRLAQWISLASPKLAAHLETLPFGHLELTGEADISAAGFFARDVVIAADRSHFKGFINITPAIGGERARVLLNLVSPALDLDNIPDLTPLTQAAVDADFSITLDARAVRLARAGQGVIDAGRIIARIKREGGAVDIEQFDIANLGGASFNAHGQLGDTGGKLAIKLNAERLVELANLLQRIAPGAWSDALARRAVALSPAALTFSAQARRDDGALRLSNLSFDGVIRGTSVSGAVIPGLEDARQMTARLMLSNRQTPMLLRQLGLETVPLDRLQEGRIDIEASGSFESGFEARARANLAGVALTYQGRVATLLPAADLRGEVKLESKDASHLLQVLALALPDVATRAPVEISGIFGASNGRFSFSNITGQALGSQLAGVLSYGAERRLSGELRLDTLSLESLASLVLGPRPPARPNMFWPDFKFATVIADPPPADILIRAGKFVLPGGAAGEGARFKLMLAPGLIAISDASFKISGGQASGRVSIRRDGANASAAGLVNYEGPVSGAGDFAGNVKTAVEFAGSGSSYAAIVSGLAGRGNLDVADLRIAASDPGALQRIIAGAQDMLDIAEVKIAAALGLELARAGRAWNTAAFDLALAGGTLTLSGGGVAPLSGTLDLRTMMLDANLGLFAPSPEDWTSAPPQAEIRWHGPVQNPRRVLNISSLVNALGVRAIEREAARIEMLEYDARERAAFNRRGRALEFLQQRETEIAAYHVEQERRATEEKRRAEEEVKRKALEEQRAAVRRAAIEAERERRDKERAGRAPVGREQPAGAPMQLVPQAPASPPGRPPASFNNPAAAGRY